MFSLSSLVGISCLEYPPPDDVLWFGLVDLFWMVLICFLVVFSHMVTFILISKVEL